MFYKIIRQVARFVLWLVNGKADYQKKEKLPEGNYILVGPHKTWWDPLYFALAASPKVFTFMAKEELFKNPILRWILVHGNAFPVNRDKPGPSAVKTPIRTLRQTDMSLIMFPSGTRHSEDLKGGAALIAKMARVPLVPAIYDGPVTLGGLFKRQPVTVRFGDPIDISDVPKINEEGIHEVEQRMLRSFEQIEEEITRNKT